MQVVLTEEQHRRLKVRAAIDSTNVSELIRIRLADIIDPEADFVGVAVPC